ncbi:ATP-binding protein [Streptomyces sp. NPDC050508]|uniref:ATP-binding protein n=1 Tax=Streptomyces sp. NPDC050508 TaxID=3155405 RepID=UPI003428C6A2
MTGDTRDADNVHPIPLLAASLRLVAVPTAVACSRMFVRHTLGRWNLQDQEENATLIMSELVTNAIKTGGLTEPDPKPWQIKAEHVIAVQLRVLDRSLFVEAWDRTPQLPVLQHPGFTATSGRGLLLVESLAKQWDVYGTPVGGKVVWAELPLDVSVEPPLFDPPHTPLRLPDGIRAPWGPVELQARQALLDHLLVTTLERRRR